MFARGLTGRFASLNPGTAVFGVLPVGNGQDGLVRGDADRRAKADNGAELASDAGRLGGDNEGGLVGGDVLAPGAGNRETSNGMAAENAAEHGQTAGEYIVHHLTHLQSSKPGGVADLSVFNFDSLFFSIALGILGCWLLWLAARKATSGVPGRFQAAVEILVEMVDQQAKGIVAQRHRAASSSLRWPSPIFVWIFLLNAMDLLPVDLFPAIWAKIFHVAGDDPHHAYLRVVPTADLSTTMGLSASCC